MFPTTKRDLWQRFNAHHIKVAQEEKKVHLVEAKFDSHAPIMKVVYREIPLKGILMDGRA
jgi:hypothetical protein